MEESKKKIYKVVLTKDGSFCEDQTKVVFGFGADNNSS